MGAFIQWPAGLAHRDHDTLVGVVACGRTMATNAWLTGHLLAVDERHGGGGIGADDRAADRSGCIQCPNNVRGSEKRETKLCVSLNDVCVAPEPQQTLDKIRAVGRRLR